MPRYTVAIVGRPNVGKTTLFNKLMRIAGKGPFIPAITDSTPGVTRDRNYGVLVLNGKEVTIIDTGGFMPDSHSLDNSDMNAQVREQAIFALQEADLAIHLLDAKEGLNPSDIEMADTIRKMGKPCLSVANKVDSKEKEKYLLEFYQLGVSEVIPVSAMTGYNMDVLLDRIVPTFCADTLDNEEIPKVAVVGRPNVGKSTLINTLLGKKRLIVSPTPGTTRDAIDSVVRYYNCEYLFIDTAGIRKRSKASEIEQYSILRAHKAIQRCDVAILLIEGSQGVVDQDQKIAGIIRDANKGVIIAINKWDLVSDPETAYKEIEKEVRAKIWFLEHAPLVTVSGLTKRRLTKIFPLIDSITAELSKRIPTSELNDLLRQNQGFLKVVEESARGLKVLYMTQVSVRPPHFVLFINRLSSLKRHHLRFFERLIRDRYGFVGCPINITVKPRRD